MSAMLAARPTRLFIVLAAFFAANAIIAEFVGVKIFALEPTLGLPAFGWKPVRARPARSASPPACCSGRSCS